MADYKFSFHEKGKLFAPAWVAPEGNIEFILLYFQDIKLNCYFHHKYYTFCAYELETLSPSFFFLSN
jgi:hypothetical protein